MKIIILLSLLSLGACAPGSPLYEMGKSTRSDIVANKGEPLREEKIPVKDGSIMVYEGDEKFQLKGDILTTRFRSPTEIEKSVLYWQHHFKDCHTKRSVVNKNKDNHMREEIELSCPEKGLSVIFLEGATYIERVVEYAK